MLDNYCFDNSSLLSGRFVVVVVVALVVVAVVLLTSVELPCLREI